MEVTSNFINFYGNFLEFFTLGRFQGDFVTDIVARADHRELEALALGQLGQVLAPPIAGRGQRY